MRDTGADVEERNYSKQPLTRAEIERVVRAAGGVAAVLNTRHEIAKANGWKERPPAEAEFVAAAERDNNLLRRPVLIAGDGVVVGKDEAAIRALLAR